MKRLEKILRRKESTDNSRPAEPATEADDGFNVPSQLSRSARRSGRSHKAVPVATGSDTNTVKSDNYRETERNNDAVPIKHGNTSVMEVSPGIYGELNSNLAVALHDVSIGETSQSSNVSKLTGRNGETRSSGMRPTNQSAHGRPIAFDTAASPSFGSGTYQAPDIPNLDTSNASSRFQYSLANFDADAAIRTIATDADSSRFAASNSRPRPSSAIGFSELPNMEMLVPANGIRSSSTKENGATTKNKASKKVRITRRIIKLLASQSSAPADGTNDSPIESDSQTAASSEQYSLGLDQNAAETNGGIRSRMKSWRRRFSASAAANKRTTSELEQRVQIAEDNASPCYLAPFLSDARPDLSSDLQFLDYIRGRNVRFSSAYCVATRSLDRAAHTNAFAFISRPIELNEFLVVKLLGIDKSFTESFTVGILAGSPILLADRFGGSDATGNPSCSTSSEGANGSCSCAAQAEASRNVMTSLPDDPAEFNVRQVVLTNVAESDSDFSLGDEIAIGVDSERRVLLICNGNLQRPVVVGRADFDPLPQPAAAANQQRVSSFGYRPSFWVYFDLRGRIVKMKLLGSVGLPRDELQLPCAVGQLIPLVGEPPASAADATDGPARVVHQRVGSFDSTSIGKLKQTELRDSVIVRAQRPLRQQHSTRRATAGLTPLNSSLHSDSNIQTQSADDVLREFAAHTSPIHLRPVSHPAASTSTAGAVSDLLRFDEDGRDDDSDTEVDVEMDADLVRTASAVLQYAAECSIGCCDGNDASGGGDQRTIDECSVCFERPPDCAIYKCGHVCLCSECATSLLAICAARGRPPVCPICQQAIVDIIKIYKA